MGGIYTRKNRRNPDKEFSKKGSEAKRNNKIGGGG
jgi:hypothetical protein